MAAAATRGNGSRWPGGRSFVHPLMDRIARGRRTAGRRCRIAATKTDPEFDGSPSRYNSSMYATARWSNSVSVVHASRLFANQRENFNAAVWYRSCDDSLMAFASRTDKLLFNNVMRFAKRESCHLVLEILARLDNALPLCHGSPSWDEGGDERISR